MGGDDENEEENSRGSARESSERRRKQNKKVEETNMIMKEDKIVEEIKINQRMTLVMIDTKGQWMMNMMTMAIWPGLMMKMTRPLGMEEMISLGGSKMILKWTIMVWTIMMTWMILETYLMTLILTWKISRTFLKTSIWMILII